MTTIERLSAPDHEQVLVWRDEQADLHAIVAIHSTARGPRRRRHPLAAVSGQRRGAR